MKTTPRLVLIALVVSATALVRAADLAVPFRNISFDEATQSATREGKLVFIDFYTTWCEPCKRLDAITFADPGVGKLVGDKAVALKLDAEKGGKPVAERYKVSAYPTLLLLKPDGAEVDRMIGFREPAAFIAEFQSALAGKPTVVRALEAVEMSGSGISPETVKARLDLGRTLARQGRHEPALQEFLWCFDEGMVKVGSYAGVRTSFLLSDLGRLAEVYPPARDALLQRCDGAERRLLQSATERLAAIEFAAICATLKDEARMLSVFDGLARDDPRRGAFGLRAFRALLPKRRYADALSAMSYESMVRMADLGVNRPMPAMTDSRALDASRRGTINNLLDYIEVLAGAGEQGQVEEMIAKLKQFDASAETDRKVEERLKRARRAQ